MPQFEQYLNNGRRNLIFYTSLVAYSWGLFILILEVFAFSLWVSMDILQYNRTTLDHQRISYRLPSRSDLHRTGLLDY